MGGIQVCDGGREAFRAEEVTEDKARRQKSTRVPRTSWCSGCLENRE